MRNWQLLGLACLTGGLSACGGSSVSASDPASVIGAIDSAVVDAGAALAPDSISPLGMGTDKGLRPQAAVDTSCTEHAEPTDGTSSDDGHRLNPSDTNFASMGFFCRLYKDTGSPDSIRGSYTLVKNISCALRRNNQLTFDGVAHTVTMTLDTNCFTAAQLEDMNNGTPTTSVSMAGVSVTASAPSTTNSYYSHEVALVIPDFGTYKMMTKITGSLTEFATMEDQGSTKQGAYAASYDSSSGVLKFEGRSDRINCSESGSCGWSRHDRFKATLSGSDVTDVFGIHSEAYSVTNGNQAWIATIQGNTTTGGLMPLMYNQTPITSANSASAYTPQSQSCTGGSGLTCASNTGLAFTGTSVFPLVSGHSTAATWIASLTSGLSLATVDFSD